MNIFISKRRTRTAAIFFQITFLSLLVFAPPSHALPGHLSSFNALYPSSSSGTNASCQLCHDSTTQFLNPFGAAICSQSGAINGRIQAVEAQDSDSDPTASDNITEINASTQPGWTPGNVNALFNRAGCGATGTTSAPPATIAGNLDPAATNQNPVANASGPYSGTVGVALTMDGSASSDPDGNIVSYDWNFGDGNTGTGISPTHTYTVDGTFTVALTVTDNAGATNTANTTATIGVGNQPPIANANGPYTGIVGTTVTFDGSGSTDSDGSIVAYSWDFGDNTSGTGVDATHSYATAGTYNVTLTVTDDAGAMGSAATSATISDQPVNQPPVANAGGPYTGTIGTAITFDGSSSTDLDGTIVDYSWDFGDGNTATGVSASHTYTTAGAFTVTLTVTDDAGGTGSSSTTATIGSTNVPPTANAGGPYTGAAGVALTFDGSASSDSDGSIASYSWDFGDGSSGTGVSPSHTYTSDGNYTVTLAVVDDAGASASASTTANIGTGNIPPTSDPNGPYNGTVGVEITFDGSGSNDSDGSIVAYNWNFGDGASGIGVSATHAYTTPGTYNVTLEVTDDSGAVGSAMTTAVIESGTTTEADVYLSEIKVPKLVDSRVGKSKQRKVVVYGDGDTVAQDATVTLSFMSPAGVAVSVDTQSVTQSVTPDDNQTTAFDFSINVSCVSSGNYSIEWTAAISAAENVNSSNDTITDTTLVRCRGSQMRGDDDDEDDDDDDDH